LTSHPSDVDEAVELFVEFPRITGGDLSRSSVGAGQPCLGFEIFSFMFESSDCSHDRGFALKFDRHEWNRLCRGTARFVSLNPKAVTDASALFLSTENIVCLPDISSIFRYFFI